MVTDEGVEGEGTQAEEVAPELRELGEVENAMSGEQPPRQVPQGQHSSDDDEFQGNSTSGGKSRALPVHWSMWCCTSQTRSAEEVVK
jgi:hypothetical protein